MSEKGREFLVSLRFMESRGMIRANYGAIGIIAFALASAALLVASHQTTTTEHTSETDEAVSITETPIPVPAGAVVIDVPQGGCECVQFAPGKISVILGVNATVAWTNHDSNTHDVVDNGVFAGSIAPGSAWVFTFTKAGTYNYIDPNFPAMGGIVVVKSP